MLHRFLLTSYATMVNPQKVIETFIKDNKAWELVDHTDGKKPLKFKKGSEANKDARSIAVKHKAVIEAIDYEKTYYVVV
ncbi:hypothetical protein JTB14_033235 [Gonioctena quinquepunctata]|nr:hypothetical protein JTB14_033235 [Gonioctena quinquepunctata]